LDISATATAVTLRTPCPADGATLHRLIANCPPLDENSMYCNLLQCSHFRQTSVVAELGDDLVGSISAYIRPDDPETLFVWQVAVAQSARGQGLAGSMLDELMTRHACSGVRFLETSVTGSNAASWAMFESFAQRAGAELARSVMFDRERHFRDEHETEYLARIGPIARPRGDTHSSGPESNSHSNREQAGQ
jgi:L-2,4-diaminobutyric acid acetyltransferase